MSKYCVPRTRKRETMHFREMATGNKNRWGYDREKFLLDNHKTMYIEDIATHVGKTVKATKDKAFRMGCSYKSKGNK